MRVSLYNITLILVFFVVSLVAQILGKITYWYDLIAIVDSFVIRFVSDPYIQFSIFSTSGATSCKSSTNESQICLTKAELEENGAGYATSLMRKGDPCFINFSKERVT